ncbi:hypothetical protein Hamer_G013263 [Homarus americanus]|uniref:Uncharacterized protein n=1 Tax=Homarus americanus TaxID=6706 RepID=A0A8J5K4D9_HOMAM|nr:hypothetical protein Hamer_G013263 [Homarus americanus]
MGGTHWHLNGTFSQHPHPGGRGDSDAPGAGIGQVPRGPHTNSSARCVVIDKTDKTEEVDLIYQVLKQAGDLGGRRSTHGSVERDLGREMGRDLGGSAASSGSGSATSLHRRYPRPTNTGSTLTVNPAPVASCSGKSPAAVGGAVAAAEAGTGAVMVIKDGNTAATMRRRLFGKKKSQSEGMDPPIRNGTQSRALGGPGPVLRLVIPPY